jgi:glyoxylase-like metal-dependent hydrolase (beta-lactamase superfamily II)
MIPFVRDFDFQYGRYDQLTPLIGRVIARNPGALTFTGTGTYVVGSSSPGSQVAVIDPGPEDEDHFTALLASVRDRDVTHVLITHTHRDHASLAHVFANETGAKIYAARLTNDVSMHTEGDDENHQPFQFDVEIVDGGILRGDTWTLETLTTPGHASNHVAFALLEENALFSGDHVMGWSTTIIAPPDGDMADYLGSLDKVIRREFHTLWPTHGAPISDVAPFLAAYREHRLEREAQVLDSLTSGADTISDIVSALYAEISPTLGQAAKLSVQAHLIKLIQDGHVQADPKPDLDAIYRLV